MRFSTITEYQLGISIFKIFVHFFFFLHFLVVRTQSYRFFFLYRQHDFTTEIIFWPNFRRSKSNPVNPLDSEPVFPTSRKIVNTDTAVDDVHQTWQRTVSVNGLRDRKIEAKSISKPGLDLGGKRGFIHGEKKLIRRFFAGIVFKLVSSDRLFLIVFLGFFKFFDPALV